MDKYIENYGKYTKRVRMLYVCSLLLFVFLAVFEYVCSGKILAAVGALDVYKRQSFRSADIWPVF